MIYIQINLLPVDSELEQADPVSNVQYELKNRNNSRQYLLFYNLDTFNLSFIYRYVFHYSDE